MRAHTQEPFKFVDVKHIGIVVEQNTCVVKLGRGWVVRLNVAIYPKRNMIRRKRRRRKRTPRRRQPPRKLPQAALQAPSRHTDTLILVYVRDATYWIF